MFKKILIAAGCLAVSAGVSYADGDAAAGEKVAKKCAACHTFDQGGKNKVGPNLFGIVGSKVGEVEGYKFSPGYVALGEAGEIWTAENLTEYLHDPKSFLEGKGVDKKTKMAFKLTKDEEIADVIAYLDTLK